MQRKMATMHTGSNPDGNTPPATETPAPPTETTPPVPTGLPSGDTVLNTEARVTLSREDYNALQANADKGKNATARLEQAEFELEEARHRLTELAARGNAVNDGSAPAPAAPVAPASEPTVSTLTDDVDISPEEEAQFGESREYVEKVAAKLVYKILNPILEQINSGLQNVSRRTDGVGAQFVKSQEQKFREEVDTAVPDLKSIVGHKHWGDFLATYNDVAGVTYQDLLAHNIRNRNVKAMAAIYKEFKNKYGVTDTADTPVATGYEGAAVGGEGGAATSIPGQLPVVKLKWSDRKKASEDYRFGRNGMTYEKLQEIDKQFKKAAEKELIDYNA
jgi:hypothetical protein